MKPWKPLRVLLLMYMLPHMDFYNKHNLTLETSTPSLKCNNARFEGKIFCPLCFLSITKQQKTALFGFPTLCLTDTKSTPRGSLWCILFLSYCISFNPLCYITPWHKLFLLCNNQHILPNCRSQIMASISFFVVVAIIW